MEFSFVQPCSCLAKWLNLSG